MALLLSGPAFAGIIQNDKPAPPPPAQPASATQEPTLDGIIHTPGVSESLTRAALELLAVLPSLL